MKIEREMDSDRERVRQKKRQGEIRRERQGEIRRERQREREARDKILEERMGETIKK